METIAALVAPAAGAGARVSSSLSNSASIASRGSLGQRRTVFCGFGGSALVCRSRARASAAPARSLLHAGADSRLGLGAFRQRRSLRIVRRSSGEENSDIIVEEAAEELEKQAEESKAAYSDAVDALKEQTIKLQEAAKGAYEPTAEKAAEILRDTTEKLKEEAEKARALLAATANETAELGKSNLNHLADHGPDPIKSIAESAVNAHLKENTRQGAKIHDFCLGIPYGAILVTGGLLWFIISGSTAAIRFGVFLGGILLALSVSSLKMWKEGKSSIPYIQGQAAIALLIFVKDARKFFKTGAIFPPAVSALASGGILAFYAYVYLSGGNPPKKEKLAEAASAD